MAQEIKKQTEFKRETISTQCVRVEIILID